MKIKVAAGFKAPDTCTCKACSQGKPHKATMKLKDALKVAKGSKRIVRNCHREHNWTVTGRQQPTKKEISAMKRHGGD